MGGYRPGYIPGKKKVSVYIDPEMHRALRVKAAETGESMGNIVERALKKELRLMTIAERIAKRFGSGDVWMLEDGTYLGDLLETEAKRKQTKGGITIYYFTDGSAIVTAEEGWWDTLEGAVAAGLVWDYGPEEEE